MKDQSLHDFILQMADNSLILGHRISEWCGHGPVLEQDIALTNIALDHIGQARMYYQLAATMEEGKTEDDYAYLRKEHEFKNLLLLEHENVDFAYTIARSFFFDYFHFLLLESLSKSSQEALAEIAAQSIKEVSYHVRYSSDWIRRLGDGTEESHQRMQKAIDDLYIFTGEFFILSEADMYMNNTYKLGWDQLQSRWIQKIKSILDEATLRLPHEEWFHKGGKKGIHTEKLGFILAEMQHMQRAYPNMTW